MSHRWEHYPPRLSFIILMFLFSVLSLSQHQETNTLRKDQGIWNQSFLNWTSQIRREFWCFFFNSSWTSKINICCGSDVFWLKKFQTLSFVLNYDNINGTKKNYKAKWFEEGLNQREVQTTSSKLVWKTFKPKGSSNHSNVEVPLPWMIHLETFSVNFSFFLITIQPCFFA